MHRQPAQGLVGAAFFRGALLLLAFFGAAFPADFFADFLADFFADFFAAFLPDFFADFLADFFADFFFAATDFLAFLAFLPFVFFAFFAIWIILLLPPINDYRTSWIAVVCSALVQLGSVRPRTSRRPIEKLNRVHHRN